MKTDVLTVKQVSKRLGIGLNQAYEACERKQIPCVRFGRRWLIPAAAFERWLATCAPMRDESIKAPGRDENEQTSEEKAKLEASR